MAMGYESSQPSSVDQLERGRGTGATSDRQPDRSAAQRVRAVATVTTAGRSHGDRTVGMSVMDETSTIVRCDPAFCAITGFGATELVGQRGLDLIHPDDQTFAMEAWMMMLEQPGRSRPMRLRHRTASGGWLWVEFVNHLTDDGSVHCEISDLSDRIEDREAVAQREQLLRQLGEALPLGVLQLDRAREITYSNDRLTHLLEHHIVETLDELLHLVVGEHRPRLAQLVDEAFDSCAESDLEVRIDPRIGCHRICSVTIRPVVDERGAVSAAIACLTDITEQVAQRDELQRRNDTDPLTGALNRRAAVDQLQAALDQGSGATVAFVDIDHFTEFNDAHGHAIGDELLVEVARRLRNVVCEDDIVGRYGGDEFIVIARCEAALIDAGEVGRRIAQVVHRPITLPTGCFDLTASVGVASTRGDVAGAERLVARAGSAMYEAREQLGDAHVVWRESA